MRARSKREARQRRHARIRKRVRGTPRRPRLSVYRSNRHIYAQLIDDRAGRTLAAASTLDDQVDDDHEDGKTGQARQVGRLIAERGQAEGIGACVFDRGGNRYAGRIAALADAAREAGLEF